jgi:hypothetical protein
MLRNPSIHLQTLIKIALKYRLHIAARSHATLQGDAPGRGGVVAVI